MIGVTVHSLRVGPADTAKDPVTLIESANAHAHRLDGARDLHPHYKGQFLTAVVPGAHACLGKVDAAGAHPHPDGSRRELPQIE